MAADPEVKKKLDTLGFVPVANTPAEFTERIKSEAARWGKVVKARRDSYGLTTPSCASSTSAKPRSR